MTNNESDYFASLMQQEASMGDEAFNQALGDAALAHLTDPRPLLILAARHAHAQKIDAAEACYLAALQCAPAFAIARFQLGLLQLTSGRPAVALVTWAGLDALDTQHPLRLFKQGFDHFIHDDLAAAIQCLEAGIAANTDNPPLNVDMQRVLEDLAMLQVERKMQAAVTETPAPQEAVRAETPKIDPEHVPQHPLGFSYPPDADPNTKPDAGLTFVA